MMPKVWWKAAALAFMAATALHAAGRMIRFPMPPEAELLRLVESGALEVLSLEGGTVLAVEDRAEVGSLGLGRGVEVLEADVDRFFEAFRRRGDEGAYHSYAEAMAEIEALAAAHPGRTRVETIGASVEGRAIKALVVDPAPGRPRAVLVGMLHAREWIATEVILALARRVVEAPPAEAGRVETWIVPVLNPDGLEWSQTQFKWWRGNRRKHPNGSYGTDLNRNFPTGWGIGSSSVPGSQTYKGPSPLSEPESKALDDLVGRLDPALTMTVHAFGGMVLQPYGYKKARPARADLFTQYAGAMAAASGYSTGPVHQMVGTTGGATDDHFVEVHKAFAMSLEVGDAFIPPEAEIGTHVEKALAAALPWWRATAALAGLDPTAPASAREAAFATLHGPRGTSPARGGR